MLKQKVLIAEDHAILREGLRSLLSDTPELEIVGEAADGQEAIYLSRKLEPHLVLMDLSMPNINGTEAMRTIKRYNPAIKIIVLTVHKSEEYVRATLDAGANGYVLKDDTRDDLLNAITNIQKGNVYLDSSTCTNFSAPWDQLTVREREITKLIAEGKKSREVAEYLSVSIKTVEKHRANLMRKLDLHNVSAITKYAIENNLVQL
jgi:two-component system response regulator NreC